jgi:hypothetical protein
MRYLTKPTQSTNFVVILQGKDALKPPRPTLSERVPKNADHAYDHPTDRKAGREVRPLE